MICCNCYHHFYSHLTFNNFPFNEIQVGLPGENSKKKIFRDMLYSLFKMDRYNFCTTTFLYAKLPMKIEEQCNMQSCKPRIRVLSRSVTPSPLESVDSFDVSPRYVIKRAHCQCHTPRLLPLNPRQNRCFREYFHFYPFLPFASLSAAAAAAAAMATRRCLLRLLSRRLLAHTPQPASLASIATRTLASLAKPLVPQASRVLASPRLFPSRCHYASNRSSGDEEEGDDDDHYDEEGSGDEWGEEEEEAVAAKPPSGKTEEEKVAEAAEIGYTVVGPLGADEKPFKPYEPVFAVVQVCSVCFPSFRFAFGRGSSG